MREILKREILKRGSITDFAESIPMRTATLINYLNGKQDTGTDSLVKILEKLGMVIVSPDDDLTLLMDKVYIKGEEVSINDIKEIKGNDFKVVTILKNIKATIVIYLHEETNVVISKTFKEK